MNTLKYSLTILIILICIDVTKAQVNFQTFIDLGGNNVSDGFYFKNFYRTGYQYQKYNIEAGIQFDLISNNPNTLTGIDVIALRELLIGDFSFKVKGFYMLNRFSDLIYETDWGVRAETRNMKHFLFEIGTNYRTFTINSSAREKSGILKSAGKLNETLNLMYVITAYLKPHDATWNLGLSVTNVDYYLINQSTNPLFNLQMKYNVKSNLTMYFESWYKQAGILNIHANYFGYFFRGGVRWEIKNLN